MHARVSVHEPARKASWTTRESSESSMHCPCKVCTVFSKLLNKIMEIKDKKKQKRRKRSLTRPKLEARLQIKHEINLFHSILFSKYTIK